MARYETDLCIIGGGISAALLAQKVAELKPGASIVVVEAGDRLFDTEKRWQDRLRSMHYGENAWPGDYIEDQGAAGVISRTMAVGGSALHWGGVCNRFSEEDLTLKSRYGLAADWPIQWSELERFYCEAERRIGVSGEPSPLPEDRRSEPYPMAAMPLSWNLRQLKVWATQSGIPFWSTPQAKNTVEYDGRSVCKRCNTCEICPTGARYSPDYTFKRLIASKAITLHDRTLVRRLVTAEEGGKTPHVAVAQALHRDRVDDPIEYRARLFVIAAGYCWSPHLLLASSSSRFPNGLANSSGLVGRYMNGHAFLAAQIELDAEIYPGMNDQHSLISRQFFRCAADKPFVRHDLRVWESTVGRTPRIRNEQNKLLVGDALLADWRARVKRGAARIRAYYDVHPSIDSTLTLDASAKNRFGDPLPTIAHKLDAATEARLPDTKRHILDIFNTLARANNGKILSTSESTYLDHPAGGCRMGTSPGHSVCDSYGRTHDHENLFVVGSPTLPTAGCTNGTLTFAALTLRSADAVATALGGRS
jgi:glucose dehydrogenase